MTRIAKIKARMAGLVGKLKAEQNALREVIKNSYILCTECKKRSALHAWKFIQNMYYVSPRSCTEGDYWLSCETKCCHLVCPKCKAEIYICTHPHVKKIVRIIDEHKFSRDVLFDAVEKRYDN